MTLNPPRYLDRTSPPHLTTLIFVTGLGAMAMNIFLPSLPRIAETFDAPYALVQLAVAGFLATNGVLQIFLGPLSDKFGRRRVLLVGLGIFVLATLGCLLARDIYTFLVFRMMQATVAVGFALSRAVVRDMNTADKAASMMGFVTMGMSLVPMIAPALGGVMDALFGWESTFWLLLVCGTIVFGLAWFDLGETAPPSNNTLLGQFREYPELLNSPRFWGYCLASALSSGAFFAFLGGGPYVASTVYGLDPAAFGLWSAMPGVGYFAGNFVTGLVAARLGVNRMVMAGSTLVLIGMAISLGLSYAGMGAPVVFFGCMGFVGLGNGMVIPSASAGMLSVRPRLAGTASGLGGTIQIGGGAALSVLAGILLQDSPTERPLVWLMFVTAVAGLVAIFAVVLRERQLIRRGGMP
ncbi:multidrug effflux MFS transporter [Pseudooceanicola aestuarii]|uniref:multidrug effflux MFS transporter n=1 Tax=Pseudooceanicola aestuarii TaxID=2697319 RepID=UPI0019546EEA|nr:multidrug effflux MFS transporter [Pseudooceanicola aestuarii]